MFTISFHNLKFYSFHGVHEEEQVLGNNYEVNVVLSFDSVENITSLEQTVNYVSVYEVVKKRMLLPTALLETVAQNLAQDIHKSESRIRSISVTVVKKNPPISNMEGSISVNYKQEF